MSVEMTIVCDRCKGRCWHCGFGEGGHDPDWCLDCGGAGHWEPEPLECYWDGLRMLFMGLAQVGLVESLVLADGQWLSNRGYRPPFKIAAHDLAMTLGYEVPR